MSLFNYVYILLVFAITVSASITHYRCETRVKNQRFRPHGLIKYYSAVDKGVYHLISHSDDLCELPETNSICKKCSKVKAPLSKINVDPGFGTSIDSVSEISTQSAERSANILKKTVEKPSDLESSQMIEISVPSQKGSALFSGRPKLVEHRNHNSQALFVNTNETNATIRSKHSDSSKDKPLSVRTLSTEGASTARVGVKGMFYTPLTAEERVEFVEDFLDILTVTGCLIPSEGQDEVSDDVRSSFSTHITTTSSSFKLHATSIENPNFICSPYTSDAVFADALILLSEHDYVSLIDNTVPARVSNTGASRILLGGDSLPVRNDIGLKGKDVVVTVSDTGFIAHNTTAFDDDDGFSRVVHYHNISDSLAAYSRCEVGSACFDHGSHVAGSVGGRLEAGIGLAPDVTLFGVGMTTHDQGQELVVDDVLYEEIWSNAYDKYKSRIFTNSWGFSAVATVGNSPKYQWYTIDDWFTDRFIWQHPEALVLFAAGNEGKLVNSLGHPGRAKNIVVVGASVNHPDTATFACTDDSISVFMIECKCQGASPEVLEVFQPMCDLPSSVTWFSSAGPTWGSRRGVDIVAPGSAVYSLDWQGGTYDRPEGKFMPGTSMATPIVAGGAALIVEKLRDVVDDGIAPYADLVRALLIVGATRDENAMWNHEGVYKGTVYNIPATYVSKLGMDYSIVGGYGRANIEKSIQYISKDHIIQVGQLDDMAFDSEEIGFVEIPKSENLRRLSVKKPLGQNNIRFVLSWIEPPMTLNNHIVEMGYENLMDIDMYVMYSRPGETSRILRVSNAPLKSFDDATDYFNARNSRDTTQVVDIIDAPDDEIIFDVFIVLREQRPDFDEEKSPFSFVTTGVITTELSKPTHLVVPNCHPEYTVAGTTVTDNHCQCVDNDEFTAILEDCSQRVDNFDMTTRSLDMVFKPLETRYFRFDVSNDGRGGHNFLLYRRSQSVTRSSDFCPKPSGSYDVSNGTILNDAAWAVIAPDFAQWLRAGIHVAVQVDSHPDVVESSVYSLTNSEDMSSYFTHSLWYHDGSNIQYTYGGVPAAKMELPAKLVPGTHMFTITNYHAFYIEDLKLEVDFPERYNTKIFEFDALTVSLIVASVILLVSLSSITIMCMRERNSVMNVKSKKKSKKNQKKKRNNTSKTVQNDAKDKASSSSSKPVFSSAELANHSEGCESAVSDSSVDVSDIEEALTMMKLGQYRASGREEERRLKSLSSKIKKGEKKSKKKLEKKRKVIKELEARPLALQRGLRLQDRMNNVDHTEDLKDDVDDVASNSDSSSDMIVHF